MPQLFVDLIDKVPALHLKTAIIILSICFVTGWSAFNELDSRHKELVKASRSIEKATDKRFDELEKKEAEQKVIIKQMAEQIKQMHSVVYRPIQGT